MIGKEVIKYSLKNLMHRKTRSFLTVFSILIGIATIFIFISFGLGLYKYVDEIAGASSADKIIIQGKGMSAPGMDETFKLTEEDLEVIEKTNGVYEAVGMYTKAAQVKQKSNIKYTYLISLDPEHPLVMEMSGIGIEKGRMLKKDDRGKVLLGYNYMVKNKIFPRVFELRDRIEIQGKELEIVGFMESVGTPQDDAQIYVLNEEIKELYPNSSDSYGWIVARADINDMNNVVDRVERNLRKKRGLEEGKEDFFVQSFEDMIETYSMVLNIVIGFIILIAGISIVVSAVNTANTMVTSVLERTKEIGTMKAIGAKNSEIFYLFLFESSFLGFVAGVLGVLLGFGITKIADVFLKSIGWGFLSPSYNLDLFIGCIAFATITGALSGALPSYRGAKTRPVDALRYE
ncbi:MAG: ABC transporter permease [Candidatus Nanoarchaeia archaeon]